VDSLLLLGVGGSLAGGFVEEDAGGDGGVEGFDGTGAWEWQCAAVARSINSAERAAAFVADEKRGGRTGEVGLGSREFASESAEAGTAA